MTLQPPSDWSCTELTSDRGSRIMVLSCPGEDHWAASATGYLEGTLTGLQPVESAATARVFRWEHSSGPYFIKEYLNRDRLDPLKNFFRASRGRRALVNGHTCARLGFNVPHSSCLVEEKISGRLQRCVLFSKAIEDAPRVRDWLTRDWDTPAEKWYFINTLAREVAAWHRAGLVHGDLRLGNILCQKEGSSYIFNWLDNERTRHVKPLPEKHRIHNLMQLNYEPLPLSLADRMRFWNAYRDNADMSSGKENEVLRSVIRKTRKRWVKRGWI